MEFVKAMDGMKERKEAGVLMRNRSVIKQEKVQITQGEKGNYSCQIAVTGYR